MSFGRKLTRMGGAVALVAAAPLAAATAVAQEPQGEAGARAIAAQGRAAFDKGDFAKGCPLLAEAYRLDGKLLGAGFALAECREKEGKLASAHRTFLEIAEKAQARGEARADEARSRAAAIAPRLSRLKVDVSAQAASRADLVVEVDGSPWPRSAWGSAEPIDGGAHEIAARAGGLAPWSTKLDVASEGARVDVTVPFDRATTPPPSPLPEETPAHDEAPGFPWKTAGIVTGAVGVGLLGAGVVVGLVAKGDYDAVEGQCDANNACTQDAATAREDARGLAGVGTVLFVGGAVLAAAGATVFLLAPEGDDQSAALVVSPGMLRMSGRF